MVSGQAARSSNERSLGGGDGGEPKLGVSLGVTDFLGRGSAVGEQKEVVRRESHGERHQLVCLNVFFPSPAHPPSSPMSTVSDRYPYTPPSSYGKTPFKSSAET